MTIGVAPKPALVWTLLLAAAGAASASRTTAGLPYGFRYARGVSVAPGAGQACAVLDADVFAHAASSLADLALFDSGEGAVEDGRERIEASELPFATTLSEPVDVDTDAARVLNRVVSQEGHLSFDLAMPARPYTEVVLDLDRRNYVAVARVWGETRPGERLTPLGRVTLFDLSAEHLFHATAIPLNESSFPYLHVELAFEQADRKAKDSTARDALRTMAVRVSVPPSREAQSLYTMTQATTTFTRRGQKMFARFRLPVHVPVERVAVTLPAAYTGDFSRAMEITAKADDDPGSGAASTTERFSGTIFRVRRKTAQGNLAAEALSVPVAIGSNMQRAATLEVAIDDASGGDSGHGGATLPVASVALEMRQRRICFDPPREASDAVTLAYGAVGAAESGARRLRNERPLALAAKERVATLEPEMELDGRGHVLAQALAAMSSTPRTEAGAVAAAPAEAGRVSLRRRVVQAIRVLSVLLLATLLAARFARRRRR